MTNEKSNFFAEYSRFLDSSGRHLTFAAISTYRNFSDELSEKEKRFLKRHLDECAECSARLVDVADVEGEQTKKGFIPLISGGIFRYAIAAMIVLGLSAVLVYYIFRQPLKENAGQASQPRPSLAVQPLDPERFVPNQLLENFTERNVRSASGTILLTPKAGDTLSTPITFSWNSKKSEDVFILTIVDNKNVQVWEDSTSSKKITFTKALEPGLYYCKLEKNRILAQVGKFVIMKKGE